MSSKRRRIRQHVVKITPNMSRYRQNVVEMAPDAPKCRQNDVGYIKISPKWGRMYQDVTNMVSDASLKSPKEATCSIHPHICEGFWGPAWGAWSGKKGKRANDRAMGPNRMTKTASIWVESMSEKWDLSLKMLCVDIQNCASCLDGEHIFRKFMKKGCRKVRNGAGRP